MASRILLADDSITIQKVVNLTFADEGIEVVAVSNGDLAERRLAEVSPDLVLADIFMPGKNGYELCEAIKENSQFQNVPVVLLVGAFEPFDQAEARRVRADAHLTKPFESRTLVETVRRLISASWRPTTGPTVPMPAAVHGPEETLDARSAGTTAGPVASQLVGKIDLSEMEPTSVAPSTPAERNTGELGSPPPDVPQDMLGVDAGEAASEAVGAKLTDTSERLEPLDLSPAGDFSTVEFVSPVSWDTQGSHSNVAIPRFDTSEPIDAAPSQDPISFDAVPPSALHEMNISGAGEGEHWFNAGSFETSKLDRPAGDGAWRAPTNGSPLSYQSPDFTLQTETGYSASEVPSDTACATLLAVDEPLGDVLFGEGVSVDSLTQLDLSSSDSLGLEFGEPDASIAQTAASTQFDLVDIAEAPTPETAFAVEENAAAVEQVAAEPIEQVAAEPVEQVAAESVEQVAAEAVEQVAAEPVGHFMSDAVEDVTTQEAPVAEDVLGTVHATQPPDPPPVYQEATNDLDWTTPRAASYSTAQLDSVVMPIDNAENVAENPASEDTRQPENVEEASFTTPASWTEEEARFTPIDIEALAVEEPVSAVNNSADFARVIDPTTAQQPELGGEAPVAESAQGPSNEVPAAPLSSAAIEEIVRRVVAEMSEAVVREVAWEVVPDCVERVIEQLTRESLSKRA